MIAEAQYQPKPKRKFSYGLWTLGNRGRDPFGNASTSNDPACRHRCDARRGRRLGRESARQ